MIYTITFGNMPFIIMHVPGYVRIWTFGYFRDPTGLTSISAMVWKSDQ